MAINPEKDEELNKLLPPSPTQTGTGVGGIPTYGQTQLQTQDSVSQLGQNLMAPVPATRSVAQSPNQGPASKPFNPQVQEDANAFYGVQATGSDPNQRGPSGFVGFNQAYQANKGAIDARNAQMAGFLRNQAGQAQSTAIQSRGGESDDAAKARDAAMRSVGLLEGGEFTKGALADQALGGGLSEFDRMLMGGTQSRNVDLAKEDLKTGAGEYERQQGLKKSRDASDAQSNQAGPAQSPAQSTQTVTQAPGAQPAKDRGAWGQVDLTQGLVASPDAGVKQPNINFASDAARFAAFGGNDATYNKMTQGQWDNFNMLFKAAAKTPPGSTERKYLESWVKGLGRTGPVRPVTQTQAAKAGF